MQPFAIQARTFKALRAEALAGVKPDHHGLLNITTSSKICCQGLFASGWSLAKPSPLAPAGPLSGGLGWVFFTMGHTMPETTKAKSQATGAEPSADSSSGTAVSTPTANQVRSPKDRSNQRLLDEAKDIHGQVRENSGAYAEAACFYASGAPVANAIGAELGVVTRDKDSGAVQRTGIGFYVRSDHLCNNTYFGNVPVA